MDGHPTFSLFPPDTDKYDRARFEHGTRVPSVDASLHSL